MNKAFGRLKATSDATRYFRLTNSTRVSQQTTLLQPAASCQIYHSNSYARKNNAILQGRYWYREKDGRYKEYNESITLIPEEFKDQGKVLSSF